MTTLVGQVSTTPNPFASQPTSLQAEGAEGIGALLDSVFADVLGTVNQSADTGEAQNNEAAVAPQEAAQTLRLSEEDINALSSWLDWIAEDNTSPLEKSQPGVAGLEAQQWAALQSAWLQASGNPVTQPPLQVPVAQANVPVQLQALVESLTQSGRPTRVMLDAHTSVVLRVAGETLTASYITADRDAYTRLRDEIAALRQKLTTLRRPHQLELQFSQAN